MGDAIASASPSSSQQHIPLTSSSITTTTVTNTDTAVGASNYSLTFFFIVVLLVGTAYLERRGIPVIARVKSLFVFILGCLYTSSSSSSSSTSAAEKEKELDMAERAQWEDNPRRGPNLTGIGSTSSLGNSTVSLSAVAAAAAAGGGGGSGAGAAGGGGEQHNLLLSPDQIKELVTHLPSRCHGRDWNLVFSTSRDGYSLSTLYARARGKGPTLIVVMDENQHVFGGFSSRDWNSNDLVTGSISYGFGTTANGMLEALSSSSPGSGFKGSKSTSSASRIAMLGGGSSSSSGADSNGSFSSSSSSSSFGSSSSSNMGTAIPLSGLGSGAAYFGSGESFIFTARPSFDVFRWTRKNNLFMLGRSDCLAFGGGGSKFGLWLDSSLEKGASGACDTYGNPHPLSCTEFFKIVRVEVWCFTLPSTSSSVIGASSLSSSSSGFLSSSTASFKSGLKHSANILLSQMKSAAGAGESGGGGGGNGNTLNQNRP